MATFIAGYINDLSAVKDNITLRLQILCTWMQPVYGKQHVKNMELIVLDEHNTKMQAKVRMGLVNQFKDRLKERSVVTLKGHSLGEIKPKFCMVNKALRLSFLTGTKVKPCLDFSGSFYGFNLRGYRSVIDLQQEENGQFDVIGHVIACEYLDIYDKNGKAGKKNSLTLVNDDLFAREDVEKSKTTATRISTASKNSTKESFVSKNPPRNIAELFDVAQDFKTMWRRITRNKKMKLMVKKKLDMQPAANSWEHSEEYYYEMEAELQKVWNLETEREARLETARKRREAH
nr:replication protein A 70 kDa DNA-binding subunit B [Tanacetum cinerariifolium]